MAIVRRRCRPQYLKDGRGDIGELRYLLREPEGNRRGIWGLDQQQGM